MCSILLLWEVFGGKVKKYNSKRIATVILSFLKRKSECFPRRYFVTARTFLGYPGSLRESSSSVSWAFVIFLGPETLRNGQERSCCKWWKIWDVCINTFTVGKQKNHYHSRKLWFCPLPSHYRFWPALPIVHHRDTTTPHYLSPFKTNF